METAARWLKLRKKEGKNKRQKEEEKKMEVVEMWEKKTRNRKRVWKKGKFNGRLS